MNRLFQSGLTVALVLAFLVLAFGASAAAAQSSSTTTTTAGTTASPVGMWRQIDDETGRARSIIEIYQHDDELRGRIVEILQPGDKAKRNSAGKVICTTCEGDRHNQPVEGMVILKGLKKDGEEWKGGTIFDPSRGKQYNAKMELVSPDRLEVRGYIGFSFVGRTQTWHRAKERK